MTLEDFLAAIPPLSALVIALGGVIANIIVAVRTGKKVDLNTEITSEVHSDTKAITGLVNGAASAAQVKIDNLEHKVELLLGLLAEHKEIAARLAQSAASAREADSRRRTDPT